MNIEKNTVSVSIIIPVYNAGEFLDETIKSVLRQSLKSFELILVNDGSTDHSGSICREYQLSDRRVKYIDQANSGVSVARNTGLLHATGEYIFFMDADDTLDSELIKTSYDVAKVKDSDIVIIGESFCKLIAHVTALPTWAQMLKFDFLKKHPSIRFPENIQPCEDGLFSHQLLALTTNIGLNPHGIYHYRHHENQNHLKINENCWKVIHQVPDWFDILHQFYTENNLFQSHALHLAFFVEHEPFEFRYLAMPLTKEQKVILHRLMTTFMSKVLPYLSEENKSLLSKPFLYFISSNHVDDFDRFYIRYTRQRRIKKNIYLFLIRFIPLKKLRRELRKSIAEKL